MSYNGPVNCCKEAIVFVVLLSVNTIMTVWVIYDRKTLVRTRRRFQNSGHIYRLGNKDIHTQSLAYQYTEVACVLPKCNREGRTCLFDRITST